MTNLVLDVETTIFQKGNPFARKNKLCYLGVYPEGSSVLVGDTTILPDIRREIISASRLVGFNTKFDLHWLRRAGETSFAERRIWDCQLAHFLFSAQRERFPSLQGVCDHYGIRGKLGVIESEYWSRGIDTPNIPREVVLEYLEQDLRCTYEVFLRQQEEFKKHPKLYNLFQIQCQDLLVLEEMEWNGLYADVDGMRETAGELYKKIEQIDTELLEYAGECSVNWESVDHISAILYGGTISIPYRELIGVFKTGNKIGQPRYKRNVREYIFPRLIEPLDGSELKKENTWSVDESTLKQVKDKSGITTLLLERANISKQLDYYEGWPELIEEMDWEPRSIHGQLSQVTSITGRLAASKPNQQNCPSNFKRYLVSKRGKY